MKIRINKHKHHKNQNTDSNQNNNIDLKKTIVLHYIEPIVKQFSQYLKKFGIKPIFKINIKLNSIVRKRKDKLEKKDTAKKAILTSLKLRYFSLKFRFIIQFSLNLKV